MKKILNWVMAATLVCGASVFTACSSDNDDNPAQKQAKKNRKEFVEHTRATMKDLAENLNFQSWEGANMLNKYFNEYVLNNPEFNKTILEVLVNAFNPETSKEEPGMLKLTLKAGGSKSFKQIVCAREQEGLALVLIVPTEFQFAIADKFTGSWNDGFTGSFKNEVNSPEGAEFINLNADSWTVSGTVNSYMQPIPAMQAKGDATSINFLISDNRETKEMKREFSFVQNGRNMLSIVANGHDVLGFRPSDAGTDMGDIPGMEEGGGPEKPDIDGDGKPDEPPTTSNSDSKLLTLLLNAVAGKSFDKLSITLLDDLTTTMSISDCSRALQLAQEAAQARRRYADEATIDQYTQQMDALIKAEMTCKGVSQTIPMRLTTQKFGVDYWTMPAFNFADENGYVSLIDLLDAESFAYGINIIDHAAEPMQQSIIVVRQLLQYFQTIFGTYQQGE